MLYQQCYTRWTRAKSCCQSLDTTQWSYATISKYFVLTEHESYSINSMPSSIIYTSNFVLAVLK